MTQLDGVARLGGSERASEVHTLVRVSFILRLLMLFASMVGFVGRELTPVALAAIVFLALTSMVGLVSPVAVEVLERHPLLAVLDILVSTALMFALGVENPLVLATLSTSVLIGVLMKPVSAALSTIVLVGGYLAAAAGGEFANFVTLLALPVMFVSVVVMGQAFRIVGARKRESERAFADLVSGAAAAQERSRLARELHDSTAKTLQGLALGARSLDLWIGREPDRAREHARDIADSAEEAIGQLRTLLSTLRHDQPDLDFDRTLEALLRDLSQLHDVRIRQELASVGSLDAAVRYELLAATREAVTNAARHSGAKAVEVRLWSEGADVCIEVVDRGTGFDLGILPEREIAGHFGVRGYTERMAGLGGSAEVHSRPGAGTRVLLVAPVAGLRETTQKPRSRP